MDEETKRLLSRCDEHFAKAAEGVFSATEFLTPAEAYRLSGHVSRRGQTAQALFWGGAPDTERTVLCALPDYYLPYEEMERGAAEEYIRETAKTELMATVSAVLVKGSTYRALTHRDYLGSILALGIRRSVVGDIVLQDDSSAVIFVLTHMQEFLCENLARIGSDKVTVMPFDVPSDFRVERRYETVTDSIASPRLDCVVGGLLNLSRERAKETIAAGLVELNYETATEIDEIVRDGDFLSARGYGKFVVDSVSETNRKGRIRLVARRYV
jgi:RNA-binding protein YlmH